MTHKKLARYIRMGDRIAIPGRTADPYGIEIHTVNDRWVEDDWTYLEVGLDAPIALQNDLSVTVVLPERKPESGYGPGSFGEFVADLPVGTELASISGRTAVWLGITGEYLGQPSGLMYATREAAPRVIKIWLDGRNAPGVINDPGNVWCRTGRMMPDALIPYAMQFVLATRELDEAEKNYEQAIQPPVTTTN